jgi:hypothetical protein
MEKAYNVYLEVNQMTTEPSFAQLVVQALAGAGRPLTVAEIKARVEWVRPVHTFDPQSTIRSALATHPLVATLGGRPAHYTWWPRHLDGSTFRHPLAASGLETGTLVLNVETRVALWPDLYVGPARSPGGVELALSSKSTSSIWWQVRPPGDFPPRQPWPIGTGDKERRPRTP